METHLKMLNRSLYVLDRRSTKDRRRRRPYHLAGFAYRGSERRSNQDRRSQAERRANWVRATDWSSVYQVVTNNDQVYDIAEGKKGDELIKFVGKKAIVTWTVEEDDGTKVKTVAAYEVIEE